MVDWKKKVMVRQHVIISLKKILGYEDVLSKFKVCVSLVHLAFIHKQSYRKCVWIVFKKS